MARLCTLGALCEAPRDVDGRARRALDASGPRPGAVASRTARRFGPLRGHRRGVGLQPSLPCSPSSRGGGSSSGGCVAAVHKRSHAAGGGGAAMTGSRQRGDSTAWSAVSTDAPAASHCLACSAASCASASCSPSSRGGGSSSGGCVAAVHRRSHAAGGGGWAISSEYRAFTSSSIARRALLCGHSNCTSCSLL